MGEKNVPSNRILILVGLTAQPTRAEVIPSHWEKVSNLGFGTPITVELKNGDRVVGQFEGLSTTQMKLGVHAAKAKISKVAMQAIRAYPKDGLGNGAAIAVSSSCSTSRRPSRRMEPRRPNPL